MASQRQNGSKTASNKYLRAIEKVRLAFLGYAKGGKVLQKTAPKMFVDRTEPAATQANDEMPPSSDPQLEGRTTPSAPVAFKVAGPVAPVDGKSGSKESEDSPCPISIEVKDSSSPVAACSNDCLSKPVDIQAQRLVIRVSLEGKERKPEAGLSDTPETFNDQEARDHEHQTDPPKQSTQSRRHGRVHLTHRKRAIKNLRLQTLVRHQQSMISDLVEKVNDKDTRLEQAADDHKILEKTCVELQSRSCELEQEIALRIEGGGHKLQNLGSLLWKILDQGFSESDRELVLDALKTDDSRAIIACFRSLGGEKEQVRADVQRLEQEVDDQREHVLYVENEAHRFYNEREMHRQSAHQLEKRIRHLEKDLRRAQKVEDELLDQAADAEHAATIMHTRLEELRCRYNLLQGEAGPEVCARAYHRHDQAIASPSISEGSQFSSPLATTAPLSAFDAPYPPAPEPPVASGRSMSTMAFPDGMSSPLLSNMRSSPWSNTWQTPFEATMPLFPSVSRPPVNPVSRAFAEMNSNVDFRI